MKKTWTIATLSLLFTLGVSFAQESGGETGGAETGGAMMSETGGMGETGGAMMGGMMGMTFADFDTDSSGDISEEEFDAMSPMMMSMMGGETGGAMMSETGGMGETGGSDMGGDTGGSDTGGGESGGG